MVVSMEKTIDTDIPGQDFGIRVSLTDLEGNSLEARNLTANLKKVANDADQGFTREVGLEPIEGKTVNSCTMVSGVAT